jgi:hypothetical protein
MSPLAPDACRSKIVQGSAQDHLLRGSLIILLDHTCRRDGESIRRSLAEIYCRPNLWSKHWHRKDSVLYATKCSFPEQVRSSKMGSAVYQASIDWSCSRSRRQVSHRFNSKRSRMQSLIHCSYVQRYSGVQVSTLFKFKDAVSPHVAARSSLHVVSRTILLYQRGITQRALAQR